MTSNIRPFKRRLRLTKGRLVGKMSQERQKLSFFIVIMFLAIFGLIVLAEVLASLNLALTAGVGLIALLNLRKEKRPPME